MGFILEGKRDISYFIALLYYQEKNLERKADENRLERKATP